VQEKNIKIDEIFMLCLYNLLIWSLFSKIILILYVYYGTASCGDLSVKLAIFFFYP